MYRINISEVTGGQTQEMARFARLPHFLFDQRDLHIDTFGNYKVPFDRCHK